MIEQRADFSVKPTLTGERAVLRPFALDEDAPALREMLRDPEALKLTGSTNGPDDMPEWDAAGEAKFWDWTATTATRSKVNCGTAAGRPFTADGRQLSADQ